MAEAANRLVPAEAALRRPLCLPPQQEADQWSRQKAAEDSRGRRSQKSWLALVAEPQKAADSLVTLPSFHFG